MDELREHAVLTCTLGDIITWRGNGARWRGCVVNLWTHPITGEPCATVQTAFGLREVWLATDRPKIVRPGSGRKVA